MTTFIFAISWIGVTLLLAGSFAWYNLKKGDGFLGPLMTMVIMFWTWGFVAVSTLIGVLVYVFFFIMR